MTALHYTPLSEMLDVYSFQISGTCTIKRQLGSLCDRKFKEELRDFNLVWVMIKRREFFS